MYLFIVSMDVDHAQEALFNEVYDTEHVPFLLQVPGVHACRRGEAIPFKVSIGGESKEVPAAAARFTALYELESPEVLTSAAWQEAVEKGRWPSVRPHTSNRSHALYKMRA